MGKQIRLSRLLGDAWKKICVVPMDHGITQGAISGLTDCEETIRQIVKAQADAVILHKGIIEELTDKSLFHNCKCIMHLSASTNLGDMSQHKVLVSSVEHAVKVGADAVSIHVNVGSAGESAMLADFGKIAEDCQTWGMPLVAMMYLVSDKEDLARQIHLVRIAEELGADVVKMEYTDQIGEVAERSRLPILIAGGSFAKDNDLLLERVDKIRQTRIKGLSIGRNIFQNQRIVSITQALISLMNGRMPLSEAKRMLNIDEQESLQWVLK